MQPKPLNQHFADTQVSDSSSSAYPQAKEGPSQQTIRRQKPFQPIPPRPRSVDFLEYEARHAKRSPSRNAEANQKQMMMRPKSSLDIVSAPDNFYYSEASYAAKMRQSALYLKNSSLKKSDQKSGSSRSRGADDAGRLTLNKNELQVHGSIVKGAQGPDTFQRSASARLHQIENATSEQKRTDESMKRLLEWKQKMLNSPLTRKNTIGQTGQKGIHSNKTYSSEDEVIGLGPVKSASLHNISHANFNKIHGQQFKSSQSDISLIDADPNFKNTLSRRRTK